MKQSKYFTIWMAVAGLLAGSPSLPAQTNVHAGVSTNSTLPARYSNTMAVDNQLNRLTTQLHLTDDQVPKVKAALAEQSKRVQELRGLSPEDRREKMRAMRVDMDSRMKGILTATQYQQFEKMRRSTPAPAKPNAAGQ